MPNAGDKSEQVEENPPVSALVCVSDFAAAAKQTLALPALDYYRSGATAETTLLENSQAMSRWYIIPRVLRDVSSMNLSTSVFGHQLSMPIAVAPTAMQKLAHPMGECATAAAAGKQGALFTLSTISTSSIEDVAQHASDTIKFFQLYIYKDRALTARLVRRAEQAGYKAIVLTVDAPTFGIRRANIRNRFTLPEHIKMANFESTSEEGTLVSTRESGSAINEYVLSLFDQGLTWTDLETLVRSTSLPVVAKGVLSRADVNLALKAGVAAVWVSNHGGRQVDGVPPSIEALPHIVAEVRGRCPVFVDGGFTEGPHIFKGLALGASLVFVGRPAVWGLAVDGENGVYKVLEILKKELESAMSNAGCRSIADINQDMVMRKELFSKM